MKPLSIEEIKQLKEYDWLYIVDLKDNILTGYYKLFNRCNETIKCHCLCLKQDFNFGDYDKTWLAYKNKEQAECKGELYKTAFELILQDVYETRLQADTLSCSSCPFMFELFDGCENQGLYEDCKTRWKEYYLEQAEKKLKELRGEL